MTKLAHAMAHVEGYFVLGSRPDRNNNPGNLRPPKAVKLRGQTGLDDAGFAIFPDAVTGWAALDRQIAIDAKRGHTLATFIAKYAPASENNTSSYLAYLERTLGVTGAVKLSEFKQEISV
jgi:hypothetical protein